MTPGMPRVTTQQSTQAEPEALAQTMTRHGVQGVLGTRWGKAAVRP